MNRRIIGSDSQCLLSQCLNSKKSISFFTRGTCDNEQMKKERKKKSTLSTHVDEPEGQQLLDRGPVLRIPL
jgi:hypothetical protein